MAPPLPFPDPLVIPPLLSHKQTFIFLHGRGSSAARFGPMLLETPIHSTVSTVGSNLSPDPLTPEVTQTFRTAFPHAKFVFPTAPPRRATIYKRCIINQWFDNWHLTEPARREELQIGGLQETVPFIHSLLRKEATLVGGPWNVVLGGLSQGCAASLISMLLWEGEPLGAVVGMCGWLPYRGHMEDAGAKPADNGGEFDLFENSLDSEETGLGMSSDPISRGVEWLREEIDVPAETSATTPLRLKSVPWFLGHGQQDPKVPIKLGREAAEHFQALEFDVTWKEYEDLGHWYSGEMLSDVAQFITNKTHWI